MKKYFVFVFLCLFSACQSRPVSDQSENYIVVQVDPKSSSVLPVADFIDSVRYVKLETTQECLLARVSRVFALDDMWIVTDAKNRAIFFFDRTGKYKYKIARRGRGPGEYIELSNTMIDAQKKRIIVYDLYARKMIFYTLQGEVDREIRDFNSQKIFRDIINLPNGHFLCYRHDHGDNDPVDAGGLWEVDSLGKFVKWVWKSDLVHPSLDQLDHAHLSYLPEAGVCFKCVETEDDYYYDGDKLMRVFSYDVKGKTAKDYAGINNHGFVSHWMNGERFNARMITQHKGNYIFTRWDDDKGSPFYTLYNRKDQTFVVSHTLDYKMSSSPDVLVSKLYYGVETPYLDLLNTNMPDAFMAAVYPDQIQKALQEEAVSEKTRQALRKYTLGLTDEQRLAMNPLLELMYVKR